MSSQSRLLLVHLIGMASLMGNAIYELLSTISFPLQNADFSDILTRVERQTDDEVDPEDGGEWSPH